MNHTFLKILNISSKLFKKGFIHYDELLFDYANYCFKESIDSDKIDWKLFICQSNQGLHKILHFIRKFIRKIQFRNTKPIYFFDSFDDINFFSYFHNFHLCLYQRTSLDCSRKVDDVSGVISADNVHCFSIIISRLGRRCRNIR